MDMQKLTRHSLYTAVVVMCGTMVWASDDDAVRFSGRVIDETGRGIGGAFVFFYEYGLDKTGVGYDRRLIRRINADADGTFEFTAPRSDGSDRLKGVILAVQAGLSMGWDEWNLKENVATAITLGRHGRLAGQIVDGKGKGIAGAVVRAFLIKGVQGTQADAGKTTVFDWLTVQTDAAGAFEFTNVPVDARAEFLVEAPGYARLLTGEPSRITGQYQAGRHDIQIAMTVGGSITGRVVDKESQQPISGVRVQVCEMRGYSPEPLIAVSNHDGTFRFSGLAGGLYLVDLAPEDRHDRTRVASPRAHLVTGQTTGEVVLEVVAPRFVEVNVADRQTGNAIKDATVFFCVAQQNPETQGHIRSLTDQVGSTDESGCVQFPVAPGKYLMASVNAPGYDTLYTDKTVIVDDEPTRRIEVFLSRLPEFIVTARNAAGLPLGGVDIVMLPDGVAGRTDAEGRCKLSFDAQDSTRRILWAGDSARGLVAIQELPVRPTDTDLILRPGVKLAGTVFDHNGESEVPGARIGVNLLMGNNRMFLPAKCRADADGRYVTDVLPAGHRYDIRAWSMMSSSGSVRIDIPAGATGQIAAPPIKTGVVTVTGRVTDEYGEPVAGAAVEIFDALDVSQFPCRIAHAGYGTTQANGTYSIERLTRADGVVLAFIVAGADGHSANVIECFPGQEQVPDISIRRSPGFLIGRITEPDGAPVAGAHVHALISSWKGDAKELADAVAATDWFTCVADQTGLFQFGGIPNDAAAEFAVIADGYPHTFTWRPGKRFEPKRFRSGQDDISIVLRKVAGLAGCVIDSASGIPVAGVAVYMTKKQGAGAHPVVAWHFLRGTVLVSTAPDENRMVVSDQDGRFSAEGLAPGDYSVFLDPFGNPEREWVSAKQTVSLEPDARAQVTLSASKAAHVCISLKDETGRPVPSANVQLEALQSAGDETAGRAAQSLIRADAAGREQLISTTSSGLLRLHTDADGRALFNVPPGEYRVAGAAAADYVLADDGGTVFVGAGQRADATVRMRREEGMRGICVDEEGRPVPGAQIRCLGLPDVAAASDAEGCFALVIDRAQGVGRTRLNISAVHFERNIGAMQRVDRGTKNIGNLMLKPVRTVRGAVVDENGSPMPSASITIEAAEQVLTYDTPYLDARPVLFQKLQTDAAGRFKSSLLPDWRLYIVTASFDGYGKYEKLVQRATLAGSLALGSSPRVLGNTYQWSEGADSIDLQTFILTKRGLSISGAVYDFMGYPVPNFRVAVTGSQQMPVEDVLTSQDGRFTFADLSEGDVTLTAGGDMYAESAIIKAGQQAVSIVLGDKWADTSRPWLPDPAFQGATVVVTVVDTATGQRPKLKDPKVYVEQEKGNRFSLPVGPDGRCRFCLTPGLHTIKAGAYPVYDYVGGKIEVKQGEPVELLLELTSRPKASGVVVDADGLPVVGAKVQIMPYGEESETIADGSFSADWQRVGDVKHFVSVTQEKRHICGAALLAPDGQAGKIVLLPPAVLKVNVRDSKGQPVSANIAAILKGPGTVKFIYSSNRPLSGEITIDNVMPPLEGYKIALEARAFTIATVDIMPGDIDYGQVKEIQVVMDRLPRR